METEDMETDAMETENMENYLEIEGLTQSFNTSSLMGRTPLESDEVLQEFITQNMPVNNKQCLNNAGCYAYKTGDLIQLLRFLILGTTGGTFYSTERQYTTDNVMCVNRLIENEQGAAIIETLLEVSVEGRAKKQRAILFVLAMCARQKNDKDLKRRAYNSLIKICRISTDLFTFHAFAENLARVIKPGSTCSGRAHKRGLRDWYEESAKKPMKLAFHVTKYRNRSGFSQKDMFCRTHIKTKNVCLAVIIKYVMKGLKEVKKVYLNEDNDTVKKLIVFFSAVDELKKTKDPKEGARLIEEHKLVWEHVPTHLLNDPIICKALLKHMPLMAMIRQLTRMTANGVLAEGTKEADFVVEILSNSESLRRAKIHPFSILVALNTYKDGKGEGRKRGKSKRKNTGELWSPNPSIVEALDAAFYNSFKFVEPTNLRYLLALDVSGSMDWWGKNVCGIFSAREAAAAMTMMTYKTEENCEVVAFSQTLTKFGITPDMKMDDVVKRTRDFTHGGTDCSLPMTWAMENRKEYDVFIVYTDNETNTGSIHPSLALRNYRAMSGKANAKLIVCAFTSTGFTIADPDDPGMFDMVGLDSNAPEIIKSFSLLDQI